MGKRRKGKAVEIKLLVPEKIYLEFEKALTNNFTVKPVYGMRSQVLTSLIVKWLDEQNRRAAKVFDIHPGSSAPQTEGDQS